MHEWMMDLTVEIEGDIGTLEEALDRFTCIEILDDNAKKERSHEELNKLYETHERLLDLVSLFCYVPRTKYLPLGPTRDRINFSASERRLLRDESVHMVGCQWLEECFEKDEMLQEDEYIMKTSGWGYKLQYTGDDIDEIREE
ncbi:unnamed protein product [Lactuca saligna]|uniref:BRCT domain-containing protein n=1 Tax=Lactuca saligna TaxID=75948 RepID=A0AA35Z7N2_LACSI|nr:unnamed protein product [Lactuca saligna]